MNNTTPYDFNGTDAGNLVYVIDTLGENLTGAEIGAYYAQCSLSLAQKCKSISKIYAIDAFKPYYDSIYDRFFDDKDISMVKLTAQHNIKWSGVEDKIELVEHYEEIAATKIDDESLDFVYLDAWTEIDNIIPLIERWSKKVRKGGIVSGHDWETIPVQDAILEYARKNNIDVRNVNNTWMWYV